MKLSFIALVVILNTLEVTAQISNDDCAHATNLGELDGLPSFPPGICSGNFLPYPDTCFISSNDGSIPNFPYFSMSGCNGYLPSTTALANDVWYKVKPLQENWLYVSHGSFLSAGIDTLHLNVWQGPNCSSLTPVSCYTLDPSTTTFNDTIFAGNQDSFYFQFSGSSVSVFGSFALELDASLFVLGPPVSNTVTMNVLCFDYEIAKTNVSSQNANDGTATPLIYAGNSPYSFNWSDGNTDSARFNLSEGEYFVTITDRNGCMETDSVLISVDSLPTSTFHGDQIKFNIHPNPASEFVEVIVPLLDQEANLKIVDVVNKTVYKSELQKTRNAQKISLNEVPNGVYIAVIVTNRVMSIPTKFIIIK